ncbi:MAG: hypothetical protein WD379_05960 [Dehalococcoidia bacterium]
MVAQGERAEKVCKHHWRIARPSGGTSTGVCRLCGASREFLNYAHYSAVSRTRKPSSQNQTTPR